ncbi:hypothetical protein D1Y84_06235 [Acidipila sp. EB88]|nr:hypothetical protein D1Y84_06235 [Acidipila sp. EB88]
MLKRSAGTPEPQPAPLKATGHIALPPEAQGDYPWDKQGSVIDLFFEDGKLHGYMTDHLDPDPQVAPAVYDFATSHADVHAVAWTTRVVHGTWYSFSGHLERGLVESPTLPGYYLLTGTLTTHDGEGAAIDRTVSLKREPGD